MLKHGRFSIDFNVYFFKHIMVKILAILKIQKTKFQKNLLTNLIVKKFKKSRLVKFNYKKIKHKYI